VSDALAFFHPRELIRPFMRNAAVKGYSNTVEILKGQLGDQAKEGQEWEVIAK
ncbi:hypothetical protein Tco_1190086, partial [Tanacetum coccineum]